MLNVPSTRKEKEREGKGKLQERCKDSKGKS